MYVQPGSSCARSLAGTCNSQPTSVRLPKSNHACKLQNQKSLVRPQFFDLQLAPRRHLRQRRQPHARLTGRGRRCAARRNFAPASLRLQHAGQSNELVGYSRISSVKRLFDFSRPRSSGCAWRARSSLLANHLAQIVRARPSSSTISPPLRPD